MCRVPIDFSGSACASGWRAFRFSNPFSASATACGPHELWRDLMKLPHRRQFLHLGAVAAALPVGISPVSAQQQVAATKGMEIDLPDVVAEVKAAFERYEQAVVSNNAAVLDDSFRDDPRTIRYGVAENLYGYREIEAFRRSSRGPGPRAVEDSYHDLRPRFCGGVDVNLSRR